MVLFVSECGIEHLEEVVELNIVVQDIHAEKFPEIFKSDVSRTGVMDDFREVISDSSQYLFVACDEVGSVLGYVWAQYYERGESNLSYGAKVLCLNHICVNPEKGRKGTGGALVEHLEKLGKSLSIDMLLLDVWCFNNVANDFFVKVGFRGYCNRMWKRY